jgi:hypothetical protein
MTLPDIINGSLELVAASLQTMNVRKLLRDRAVAGVHWHMTGFYVGWGLWNCYFYPSLGQWFSFAGGVTMTCANIVWVTLAMRFSRAPK